MKHKLTVFLMEQKSELVNVLSEEGHAVEMEKTRNILYEAQAHNVLDGTKHQSW